MHISAHNIVIAGGGPTGLMLACELALCGVRPLVLELLTEPTRLSKALGFSGRAVDILDYRGILDRFRAESPAALGNIVRFAHFGGIPLDVGKVKDLQLRFVPLLQARTEAILQNRALELGIEIQRGSEVVGIDQYPDSVTVRARTDGVGERVLEAAYVVGCDGGRSAVRKLAGIAFPGTEPTLLLRLADVKLPTLTPDVALPFGMLRIGPEVFRVTTLEPYPQDFDRNAPMTVDEMRDSVRRVHGVDLPMSEPQWLSRFTDASRQAEQYRASRVFLAGDAAHIHLPAGGPGLSTGLNDAANLGWKLAAAVRGWAPPGLLDTYHAERHPVGARVLMHTRVQAALLRPAPHRQAMRELFTELLQDESAILRIGNMLGGNVRYSIDANARESHPLLGAWTPDLRLATESGEIRVAELMHHARGVLLNLGGQSDLARITAEWSDRVDVVNARCDEQPQLDALLIRPDGYVAWVLPTPAPAQPATGLREALANWFGKPQTRSAASD